MSAVLGIDPGVNGGVSVLSPNGAIAFCEPLRPAMTHRELVLQVKAASEVLLQYGGRVCFIERVSYKRGDGGLGAFTFGQVNGLLRGAALAYGLEVHDVAPLMWQARLGCLTGGNKNVSKRKARELFDGRGVKITHAVADSLLIARFGQITLDRSGNR